MEGPDRATWFAGDLEDPWVVAIAEVLPRDSLRFDCPVSLPESWPNDRPTPHALVVHRSNLTAVDAQRIARLKARADWTPRVILCVGPQARYVDVERWSRLVDAVVPEATARETIASQALGFDRKPGRLGSLRTRIAVISPNYELRTTLAEATRSGGYTVDLIADLADAPAGIATVWDVPILEPDWPTRLEKLAKLGPVVALLGFADRMSVTLARRHGASACLDLPCEVADLLNVLDRIVTFRLDQPHDIPPQPLGLRSVLARKSG